MFTVGKSAEHHYAGMTLELPTLLEMGARSIRLSHYSLDGAMFTAVRGLMHARHGLPHLNRGHGDGQAWLRALLDWQVYTRCACHDSSLSMAWALRPYVDKDGFKDLFIVVESLRNSYAQLHRNLKSWLSTVLIFEEVVDLDGVEGASAWWKLVGVGPAWAERLASLNLRWDGKNLRATPITAQSDYKRCTYAFCTYGAFANSVKVVVRASPHRRGHWWHP